MKKAAATTARQIQKKKLVKKLKIFLTHAIFHFDVCIIIIWEVNFLTNDSSLALLVTDGRFAKKLLQPLIHIIIASHLGIYTNIKFLYIWTNDDDDDAATC